MIFTVWIMISEGDLFLVGCNIHVAEWCQRSNRFMGSGWGPSSSYQLLHNIKKILFLCSQFYRSVIQGQSVSILFRASARMVWTARDCWDGWEPRTSQLLILSCAQHLGYDSCNSWGMALITFSIQSLYMASLQHRSPRVLRFLRGTWLPSEQEFQDKGNRNWWSS